MSDKKDLHEGLHEEGFAYTHNFRVQSVLQDRESDEASYNASVIKKSREINTNAKCPFSYR